MWQGDQWGKSLRRGQSDKGAGNWSNWQIYTKNKSEKRERGHQIFFFLGGGHLTPWISQCMWGGYVSFLCFYGQTKTSWLFGVFSFVYHKQNVLARLFMDDDRTSIHKILLPSLFKRFIKFLTWSPDTKQNMLP